MPPSPPPTIYTAEEIADILQVNHVYVLELARKGTIGSFKIGHKVRITGEDLTAYIEKNRRRPSFLKQRKEDTTP